MDCHAPVGTVGILVKAKIGVIVQYCTVLQGLSYLLLYLKGNETMRYLTLEIVRSYSLVQSISHTLAS